MWRPMKAATVTAGLKWAPEIRPRAVTITARTIPCARATKTRSIGPKLRTMFAGVALLPSSLTRRAAALTMAPAPKKVSANVPRNSDASRRAYFIGTSHVWIQPRRCPGVLEYAVRRIGGGRAAHNAAGAEIPVAAIQTRGLTRDFGAGRGLFDLDLEVQPGEAYGYLGPNGAGKSTTLRLLMGLIRPTSGSARIFVVDVTRDPVRVKGMVGYLPGELAQFGDMRGGQVLSLPACFPSRASIPAPPTPSKGLGPVPSAPDPPTSAGNKQTS